MTQKELEIAEAFCKEYERLCDLFVIDPEKHKSYRDFKEMLNDERKDT